MPSELLYVSCCSKLKAYEGMARRRMAGYKHRNAVGKKNRAEEQVHPHVCTLRAAAVCIHCFIAAASAPVRDAGCNSGCAWRQRRRRAVGALACKGRTGHRFTFRSPSPAGWPTDMRATEQHLLAALQCSRDNAAVLLAEPLRDSAPVAIDTPRAPAAL